MGLSKRAGEVRRREPFVDTLAKILSIAGGLKKYILIL